MKSKKYLAHQCTANHKETIKINQGARFILSDYDLLTHFFHVPPTPLIIINRRNVLIQIDNKLDILLNCFVTVIGMKEENKDGPYTLNNIHHMP